MRRPLLMSVEGCVEMSVQWFLTGSLFGRAGGEAPLIYNRETTVDFWTAKGISAKAVHSPASARSGGQLGARQRAGEHEPAGVTRNPFATRPATAARDTSERLAQRPVQRSMHRGMVNMRDSVGQVNEEGKRVLFIDCMMT